MNSQQKHEPIEWSWEGRKFQFFDIGFHGDRYLLMLVDFLIQRCSFFLETGTSVGSTISYVAKVYPHVKCFSCEVDPRAFARAQENTSNYPNIEIYNETAKSFCSRLQYAHQEVLSANVLWWLDAHGSSYEWHLPNELEFISTYFRHAFVLIDDFKVPGQPQFRYDFNIDQRYEATYENVKSSIRAKHVVYYPTYTERTSPHHPLCGWALIEIGEPCSTRFPERINGTVFGI